MKVRQKAVELTTDGFMTGSGLRQKDFDGEARRLLEFVRDDIRYGRDIADVETLHDAVTILDQGAGDCDDKCILLAALLLSIGFDRLRFIAVAFEPDLFSHVWLQVVTDPDRGGWVDLEPTEPIQYGQSIPTRDVVEYVTQDI